MQEELQKYVDIFPKWLSSLPDDVTYIASIIEDKEIDYELRKELATGINYLFKSMDLIPDGIDDIGYMDDCFIIRIVAFNAYNKFNDKISEDKLEALKKLHDEADYIKEFLGEELWNRLLDYVVNMKEHVVRGRSAEDILKDETHFRQFQAEVKSFIASYNVPQLPSGDKFLVKLKAFLDAKLP